MYLKLIAGWGLTLFTIFFVFFVAGSIVTLLWRNKVFNPSLLFVLFSAFFAIATIPNLDLYREADYQHLLVIVTYFLSLLGYYFFVFDHRRDAVTTRVWVEKDGSLAKNGRLHFLGTLFFLSFLVTFVYFQFIVGYNLLFLALTSGVDDFTSMRLAAYSGENYTGAGVVNQFKNTILPISFFSILIVLWSLKRRAVFFVTFVILTPLYLWSILGTGQRTFLFFNFVCLALYMIYSGKVSVLGLSVSGLVVVFFFSLFSFFLGRTSGLSFVDTIDQLVWRIFLSNQMGSVVGFRYVFDLPNQYGAEWMQVLTGMVPGVRGSDLPNRIHDVMFGSFRGTTPVSLWVSIYHNFGLLGIPLVLFFILKVVELSRLLIKFFSKEAPSLVVLSFFCFYIGIMPMTNPFQILNNGLLALLFFIFLYGFRVNGASVVWGMVRS